MSLDTARTRATMPLSFTCWARNQNIVFKLCSEHSATIFASSVVSELEEATELYVLYVGEETEPAVSLDIDPVSSTVLPEGQLLFFAAIQACIERAMRGRFKPRIAIRLRNPGSATVLELEVVSAVSQRDFLSGWAAIRERARTPGGEFDVIGDSTRVSARLSLPVRLDYEHG